MIILQLNKKDFEYDLYSLIRAFYPGTEVTVLYGEEETEDPYTLRIQVAYSDDAIRIRMENGDRQLISEETEAVDYPGDRKETKNRLKYRLYRMLERCTGQSLPWGTLTGIRPTKIPMAFLEEGKKPAWIAQYMRETYLTSPEKTALGISIAVREREI